MGNKVFFLKYILGILCVERNFVMSFLTSTQTLQNLQKIAVELKYSAKSEPFYKFAFNAEREFIITDGKYPIENRDAMEVVEDNIDKLYDLNNKLFQSHNENRKIHTESYSEKFQKIMRKNICE